MSKCISCGKDKLSSVEIGLNKKLIRKDVTEFLCFACLSNKFHTTKDKLVELADNLKKIGCSLFDTD